MAININLKELFSADSQSDLTSKLNFNFNQLMAYGVGEVGPIGPQGPTGSAGPVGPQGPKGPDGTQIYGLLSGSIADCSTSGIVDNSRIGDYYIDSSAIYKRTGDNTTWDKITDFNALLSANFQAAGISWIIGTNGNSSTSSTALTPVNSLSNKDRITTVDTLDYLSNSPNYSTSGASNYNSQVVISNFDINTTAPIVYDATQSQNGYEVFVTNRFGAGPAQSRLAVGKEFPYTSMLSLYSFYQGTQGDIEADQFNSSTGYRHQLELGSVDDLSVGGQIANPNNVQYIISPTYQNLRIRKYRKADTTLIGNTAILADYNLHSLDSPSSPAVNSKQSWTINKKIPSGANTGANTGYVIKMSLSSSTLEASTTLQTTGINTVDGLHFKIYSPGVGANPKKFAIGFGIGADANRLLIKTDSGSNLTDLCLDKLGLNIRNGTATLTATANPGSNDIYSSEIFTISSNSRISLSAGTTLGLTAASDIAITTLSSTSPIKIGYNNNWNIQIIGTTTAITGTTNITGTANISGTTAMTGTATLNSNPLGIVGEIKMFYPPTGVLANYFNVSGNGLSNNPATAGWALCDGQNGRLDMRGRVPVGLLPGDADFGTINQPGGVKSVTLSSTEQGTFKVKTQRDDGDSSTGSYDSLHKIYFNDTEIYSGHNSTGSNYTVSLSAASSAHTNLQPYRTIAFIQRVSL